MKLSEKNLNHKSISDLENNHPRIVYKASIIIILFLTVLTGFTFGANNNPTRQVIISFDDGYYSVYKYAYPVLKKHRLPMTLALITSYLEKSNKPRAYGNVNMFLNRGEVQEMIDNLDIEVASHSVNHPDLARLSDDKIIYELQRSKHVLDSIFNQQTTTFVYPYGAVNKKIIELTKNQGYKLGRSIRWGEPNLWVDRYLLPIKEVRNTTSVDEIIQHTRNYKTTVLLFHRLSVQPAVFTEWSANKFNVLIEQLSADENVKFLTLNELYLQWWRDIMTKYIKEKGWLDYSISVDKIDIDQTRTLYPGIIK